MKTDPYLGMRPGDLDGKPYAKYWNPEMRPLQPQVQEAVLHGEEASELGFPLEQADLLLEPGTLPLENGTTKLANGGFFVAVQTKMPGVTGEMLEWWVGWHPQENQRYKLWHPRAHLANGTAEMWADDPSLTDKQKYMTTHLVTEYVGPQKDDIAITFEEPSEYFTDVSDLASTGTTAVVCGHVCLQRAPVRIAHLIHQFRETDAGAELRSRFWLGPPALKKLSPNHWINRALASGPVSRRTLAPKMARDLLVHCGMEMNHLAGFLPALYADYHP